MIRVNEIRLELDETPDVLKKRVAKILRISENDIAKMHVFRKSVDSRRKHDVHFKIAVDVIVDSDEESIVRRAKNNRVQLRSDVSYTPPEVKRNSPFRPVVVGFGPAGMFAALLLAKAGMRPIVLERGKKADERKRDVDLFWTKRILHENSNVQFGEGGAGTFSDGKLTTGIRDPRCREVLEQFITYGAPTDILYSAKPHIGTDLLIEVVMNMRRGILELGGEILFETKMEKTILANGSVHGVEYSDKHGTVMDIETDCVILAFGHSARDTVQELYNAEVPMERKPFSVGTRIEHPQKVINKAQYGEFANHPALGAAEYKLAVHPKHGRGAYTFCMCPGGTVVMASSEKGGVVVNGMSEHARDGENANSAILVNVLPENLQSEHVLEGFFLQRKMEQKAFQLGGESYAAPAQLVGDFLQSKASRKLSSVKPSCPTGVVPSNLDLVLPKYVTDTMKTALIAMDRRLHGFAMSEAVLTGVESRSSSPVRITRNEFYQSAKAQGLFPCGEGAGYAGGIVSAAVDGIKCAEAVLQDLKLEMVMD